MRARWRSCRIWLISIPGAAAPRSVSSRPPIRLTAARTSPRTEAMAR